MSRLHLTPRFALRVQLWACTAGLLLAACRREDRVVSDTVVARVAGQPVLQQEVRQRFAQRVRDLREYALSPDAKQALWRACVDDVVLERVVGAAARDRQVAVLEDEVDAFVRRLEAPPPAVADGAPSTTAPLPIAQLKEAARAHLLMGKYVAYQVAARIEVSDADLVQFAQARPELLQRPAQVRLRFLRVPSGEHLATLKKAIARGKAPADAAATMAESVAVGDLGFVSSASLPAEVRSRVERLPLRKLSEPVALGEELAVFWVSERRAAMHETPGQARRRLERLLRHEREAQAETQVLTQLKEAAHAEVLHAGMPKDL